MATIVCQGLQSCLESQIVESRTLKLRLPSSPKSPFSLELALKQSSSPGPDSEEISDGWNYDEDENSYPSSIQNPDVGIWRFFQDFPNGSLFSGELMEKANVYVHPVTKRFPSTLSEKSLELCTENLGNETGTIDVMETSSSFSSSLSSSSEPESEAEACRELGRKKAKCKGEFPPPLTTIRGSESFQVRSYRQDGRLIIKAIKGPVEMSNFQAERSEGRLRLRLFKDSASNFDLEDEEENEFCGQEIGENKRLKMTR